MVGNVSTFYTPPPPQRYRSQVYGILPQSVSSVGSPWQSGIPLQRSWLAITSNPFTHFNTVNKQKKKAIVIIIILINRRFHSELKNKETLRHLLCHSNLSHIVNVPTTRNKHKAAINNSKPWLCTLIAALFIFFFSFCGHINEHGHDLTVPTSVESQMD